MSIDITRNDAEGMQVEWNGLLITIRPSEHHGIIGSVGIMKKGKLHLLEFHGVDEWAAFPLKLHESVLEEE
jgi:hypothetical protein